MNYGATLARSAVVLLPLSILLIPTLPVTLTGVAVIKIYDAVRGDPK